MSTTAFIVSLTKVRTPASLTRTMRPSPYDSPVTQHITGPSCRNRGEGPGFVRQIVLHAEGANVPGRIRLYHPVVLLLVESSLLIWLAGPQL